VFSPDGAMIAFVVTPDRSRLHQADLRVVGLDGRPPLTVATNAVDHRLAPDVAEKLSVLVGNRPRWSVGVPDDPVTGHGRDEDHVPSPPMLSEQ
jgi:hypothetical protein